MPSNTPLRRWFPVLLGLVVSLPLAFGAFFAMKTHSSRKVRPTSDCPKEIRPFFGDRVVVNGETLLWKPSREAAFGDPMEGFEATRTSGRFSLSYTRDVEPADGRSLVVYRKDMDYYTVMVADLKHRCFLTVITERKFLPELSHVFPSYTSATPPAFVTSSMLERLKAEGIVQLGKWVTLEEARQSLAFPPPPEAPILVGPCEHDPLVHGEKRFDLGDGFCAWQYP